MEFHHEEMQKHQCRAWQEGEWIYFQCPQCSFLRKMNWQSGEMITLRAGDKDALHHGLHASASQTIEEPASN
jgi:hypothetical protein